MSYVEESQLTDGVETKGRSINHVDFDLSIEKDKDRRGNHCNSKGSV